MELTNFFHHARSSDVHGNCDSDFGDANDDEVPASRRRSSPRFGRGSRAAAASTSGPHHRQTGYLAHDALAHLDQSSDQTHCAGLQYPYHHAMSPRDQPARPGCAALLPFVRARGAAAALGVACYAVIGLISPRSQQGLDPEGTHTAREPGAGHRNAVPPS